VTPILELSDVSRSYGSLRAVDRVSFGVEPGARHAVIGPNGAGKSTLFAVVAGTIRADAGRISFAGRDVTGLSEPARCRLGLARTFQHSSVFVSCSVLDNVRLAAQRVAGLGLRLDVRGRRLRSVTAEAYRYLDEVGLGHRAADPAGQLSHGERRQLEIAMVLATEPSMVMLDEPTAGMSGPETQRFVQLVSALPAAVTVVVIEHDLDVAFQLATAVTVLHLGRVLASGSPRQIRSDPAVQAAYLGTADRGQLFPPAGGGE
jgi:branched-chain amino acid transport system ATP-binding protein